MMSDPFIGEIRLAGFNFAPQGWAFCDGTIVAIDQNPALFQLIGTTYGGDGQQTFALPDLRSRVPIHVGTGPGGTFVIGQRAGTEQVTLTSQQIPNHNHSSTQCSNGAGSTGTPANGVTWSMSKLGNLYLNNAPAVTMGAQAIGNAGGNQPHENRQPSLAINYIFSLFGIFPSQN
jgi:microcystin-dependent protein